MTVVQREDTYTHTSPPLEGPGGMIKSKSTRPQWPLTHRRGRGRRGGRTDENTERMEKLKAGAKEYESRDAQKEKSKAHSELSSLCRLKKCDDVRTGNRFPHNPL